MYYHATFRFDAQVFFDVCKLESDKNLAFQGTLFSCIKLTSILHICMGIFCLISSQTHFYLGILILIFKTYTLVKFALFKGFICRFDYLK